MEVLGVDSTRPPLETTVRGTSSPTPVSPDTRQARAVTTATIGNGTGPQPQLITAAAIALRTLAVAHANTQDLIAVLDRMHRLQQPPDRPGSSMPAPHSQHPSTGALPAAVSPRPASPAGATHADQVNQMLRAVVALLAELTGPNGPRTQPTPVIVTGRELVLTGPAPLRLPLTRHAVAALDPSSTATARATAAIQDLLEAAWRGGLQLTVTPMPGGVPDLGRQFSVNRNTEPVTLLLTLLLQIPAQTSPPSSTPPRPDWEAAVTIRPQQPSTVGIQLNTTSPLDALARTLTNPARTLTATPPGNPGPASGADSPPAPAAPEPIQAAARRLAAVLTHAQTGLDLHLGTSPLPTDPAQLAALTQRTAELIASNPLPANSQLMPVTSPQVMPLLMLLGLIPSPAIRPAPAPSQDWHEPAAPPRTRQNGPDSHERHQHDEEHDQQQESQQDQADTRDHSRPSQAGQPGPHSGDQHLLVQVAVP